MKKSILILLFFSVGIIACSKQKNNTASSVDLGLAYYPTQLGKFVVYDVDSIIYTDLTKDTLIFKYRIKEKLADTYTDNLGQTALRMERYIKKYNPTISYDSIPWLMKEVWSVTADQLKVQVVESNTRFTKLVFPIQDKASWNGNANNALGEQSYTYEYIDRSEKIGPTTLQNVLQVSQKDVRTLINYEHVIEKYAKNIGLVYREITNLQSNAIVASIPVEDRIEQGLIYKQTLVTHGYE